jgi:hypothetical protein
MDSIEIIGINPSKIGILFSIVLKQRDKWKLTNCNYFLKGHSFMILYSKIALVAV